MGLSAFRLRVPIDVRLAEAHDVPGLEWEGLLGGHRHLIAQAFARQAAGECALLLALVRDRPMAQVWIDFTKRAREPEPAAVFWAVRVIPWLQGLGLGRRLLKHAERLAVMRSFCIAEIGVEIENAGARRLYERLGYRIHDRISEPWQYVDAAGRVVEAVADQWLMRRRIAPRSLGQAAAGSGTSRRLAISDRCLR